MSTAVDIKNVDYTTEMQENGQPKAVMNILGRGPDNEFVHLRNEDIQPHFCVLTEEFDDDLKQDERVVDWESGHTSIYGHDLTRVYTRIPGDVPKVRTDYEHYEADILFPNRWLIDAGIYDAINVPDEYATDDALDISLDEIEATTATTDTRIFFCDIEVDDEKGFPDESEATEEIISISLYDSFKEEYHVYYYHPDNPDVSHEEAEVHMFTNEADMMSAFCEHIVTEWPDVLAGWNFKDFDARYIVNRLDQLEGLSSDDISPLGTAYDDGSWSGGKIRGISVFDMLKAYKNLQYTELDSYSLEEVAQSVLGYGKIEDNRRLYEQWHEDPQQLLDYNVQDVKLTVELEEHEDIIKFNEEKAAFSGGRLAEVIDPSQAVDVYILHVVNEQGYVLPSAATVEGGESFEGAQVFDPSSGIKQMVEVLDLASLYPMSMKTLNAGPTTKDPDGDITAPNGVSFTTERQSLISGIIDDLLEERQDKKDLRDQHAPGTDDHEKFDRQQGAVKVIMNTLYGVMGWDRFRLYDKEVGAAVTAVGRECIKFTQTVVSEMGYDVIYGDTDSVMVELGSGTSARHAIEIGHKLEIEINARYDEFAEEQLNVEEHFFEIEFEKLYRRFFQAGKKKRYAGHVIWKEGKQVDSIGITGFEFRRSDYSPAAKNLQKDVLDKIVRGSTFTELSNLIQHEIKRMKEGYYDWDELGIPGSIGQAFEKYDSKTLTVKGSEYANENLGAMIQPGDKPKGIYVDKVLADDLPPLKMKTPYICWMKEQTINSVVPDKLSINWEKYIEVQVEGPLARIFEGTEWTWGGMLSGQEQGSMFDFGESDDDSGMFEDVTVSREPVVKDDDDASTTETTTTSTESTTAQEREDPPDLSLGEYEDDPDEDAMFEEVEIRDSKAEPAKVEDDKTESEDEDDEDEEVGSILDEQNKQKDPMEAGGQTGLGDW